MPEARFRAMKEIADAGITVGIGVAPVIPGYTESDIPGLLERAQRQRVRTHPGVSQPTSKAAMARWKRDLDAEGRRAFKGAGQALLVELGYARDEAWMDEAPIEA